MLPIHYSDLAKEADEYWKWHVTHPIIAMDKGVAHEGAGSELRSPLFHFGTVVPIYLCVIRYLRKLPTVKGLKLVELGSGSGRLLAYLQSLFPDLEITGTDYSRACIDYAQRAYGQYGITFLHDSAQHTRLKANSMDFVISSHVIEHIKAHDGQLFLRESRRLLKPGGMLFVGTPERRKSQNVYMKNPTDMPHHRLIPPHEHEYTYTELKDLACKIYQPKNVTVDKIVNPVFYNLFKGSVAKFRVGTLGNVLYVVARDYLPKLWFDRLSKAGSILGLRAQGVTYFDILMANRVLPGNAKNVPDNLLLVATK